MKNLFYLLVTIFVFTSCENHNLDNARLEMVELNTNNTIEKGLSFQTNAKDAVKVTCKETCTSGSICGLIWDMPGGTVECSCEGCKMYIESSNEKSKSNLFELIDITKNYDNISKSGIINANYILYEDYEKAEILFVEYMVDNSKETIMYVFKKDENGKRMKEAIVVDCSGGCDSAGATCRERYLVEGGFECTCQGSCKMTITK